MKQKDFYGKEYLNNRFSLSNLISYRDTLALTIQKRADEGIETSTVCILFPALPLARHVIFVVTKL